MKASPLIIKPRPGFRHGGDLPRLYDSYDPRAEPFGPAKTIVDLRECQFIQPPAVLWCLVYLLLARAHGTPCELWVPKNAGVCTYLKAVGLFRILQENQVEVDDRGIRLKRDTQAVLSLTRFDTEAEVDRLANKAIESLHKSRVGASNLHPLVSETFGELAMNAVQHADSPVGAYGLVQFYDFAKGKRFVCAVADGGVGIRHSLERNPAHRDRIPYDWVAIELAIRERVSGTLDPHRGIGLYGVAEDMRKAGRSLIIHSGIGRLQISENLEARALRSSLFPGTLVSVSIPT